MRLISLISCSAKYLKSEFSNYLIIVNKKKDKVLKAPYDFNDGSILKKMGH